MRNSITIRNACYMAFMFCIANAYMWGKTDNAGRDSWIFVLAGMLIYSAVLILYAKVSMNDPGKNLFELFETSLGRTVSKLISIFYIAYGFCIIYFTSHFYTDFISTNILQRTPRTLILGAVILTCVILACAGRNSMGWWSSFFIVPIVFVCLFDLIFSAGNINTEELMPMLYEKEIIAPSIMSSLVFPLGEIILLFSVYGGVEKQKRSCLMWCLPWIAGNILIALVYARNTAVLGEPLCRVLAFSTYFVQSIVSVSAELQRVEVLISVVIWFANILCGAVALMFASHGLMLFTGKRYENAIIVAVGVFVFAVSIFIQNSAVEIVKLVDKVKFWLIIMQIAGPLAVFICQATKKIKINKSEN